MWQEFKDIKSGKKDLRQFGLLVGAILAVLGAFLLWRGRPSYPYFLVPGLILIFSGAVVPQVLLPFQKAWMIISIILGFFVSRALLVLIFYAVLTPMGLVMKMLGKDILDERIDKNKKSYWIDRIPAEEKDITSYENQY